MVQYSKRPGFNREVVLGPDPTTYSTSGSISSATDLVLLDAPGSASAVVTVKGTFTGTLSVFGFSGDLLSVKNPLNLFQPEVGSLGQNTFTNNGVEVNKTFRVTPGGKCIVVEASGWTSGTAEITVYASQEASTVLVNGPVHGSMEEAIRDQRAFVASTGVRSVDVGNVMILTFSNPVNSGVNVHLVNRLFGNNRPPTGENMEYTAYATPTYVPANTQNGINLKGAVPFSQAQFLWEVRTQLGLTVGGIEGSGEVLPNGTTYSRPLEVILKPGRGVGYVINGAGNNLLQAARVSMTLEWYEESI